MKRLVALLFGLLSHGLFLVAIGSMIHGLYGGLQTSLLPPSQDFRWLGNGLLALQFPLLHSFLLTASGRRKLKILAPRGIAGPLLPTLYALVASIQIGATLLLWSPSGSVWWQAEGAMLTVFQCLFAASWLFLMRAMYEAGLSVQTGAIGWISVFRNRTPQYPGFPRTGLHGVCRQPIYLAFAATLWTGPTLTPDRLLLASVWTAYCVVGALHKESRYLSFFGNPFRDYRSQVPFLPWSRAARPALASATIAGVRQP